MHPERMAMASSLQAKSFERPSNLEPCASCGARSDSVCGAVVGRDLRRLAEVAMPMRAEVGRTFITERDPAHSFFNVTSGTARLFKSLSDGRRQIVGFAGRGHFLGVAVGARCGLSAEAIEPVRYCRFSRKQLRIVLDDFPAFEDRLLQVAANELVAARWFSWPNMVLLAPVPIVTAAIAYGEWQALSSTSEVGPFVAAISLWPMIVPHTYSLWDAASSPKTQAFRLIGTVSLLPIILLYTGWSYWVLRGKVRADVGYH